MKHRSVLLAALGAVFVLGAVAPAVAEPGWGYGRPGWHQADWREAHWREVRAHERWEHERWEHRHRYW